MSKKQTIHNFVTIGTAQHKRSKSTDLGYVHPKHTTNSVFLEDLDRIPNTPDEKETWINGKLEAFKTPLNTYKEVYALCGESFEDLIDGISEKKQGFIERNLERIMGSQVMEPTVIAQLWDNLIYQGLIGNTGLLSDTILNVLIIEHIADALRKDQELSRDVTRVAELERASVLIPNEILSKSKKVSKDNDIVEVPYSKALANQLEIATQNREIKILKEAKEAIENAITTYNEEVSRELNTHMDAVNELILEERRTNGYVSDSSGIGFLSSDSSSSSNDTPQSSSSNIQHIGDDINGNSLGFFNAIQLANVQSVQNLQSIASSGNLSSAVQAQITSFTPSTTLNSSYISQATNAQTAAVFNTFSAQVGNNPAAVPGLISNAIGNQVQNLGSLLSASQTVLMLGNTAVTMPDSPTEDMFAIILKKVNTSLTPKYALHITQHFKAVASEALKFDITLTDPDGTDHTESSTQPEEKNAHYTSFVLLENGIDFDVDSFGSLTGSVKLRNGNTITFDFDDLKVDEVFMAKPNYQSGLLEENEDDPKLYGVSKIGIAVFRRVEQELLRYELGEIADMETAEAGSYKYRKVKYLNRKTKFSEDSKLLTKEISKELATNASSSISEEVQSSSSQTSSKDYGFSAGVSGTFGALGAKTTFSADAYADFSSSNSTEESNRLAVDQAKDISEIFTEQVTSEVHKLRSVEVISEREETVETGYDHTKSTENKTSVFRWVDKVLNNKLVNYGKRLMYEFMIPEPALNFKASLENPESTPSDIILLKKPKHPKDLQFGLNSANDLTPENYLFFASAYGAEVESAPDANYSIGKGVSVSGSVDDNIDGYHNAKNIELNLPDGYECRYVSWSAGATDVDGDAGWPEATLDIAARGWKIWPQSIQALVNQDLGVTVAETLPISLRTRWAGAANVNVIAHCTPTKKLMDSWKIETFNAIMQAYEQKVRAFNASMEDSDEDREELNEISVSSFMARALERRELTRSGIEMVTEPFKINTARNNYRAKNVHNVSKIDKTLAFERHASHVKFLEQAFDWHTMAYKFYPYYWANESKWHELMNTTNKGDLTFQAFLQAGMSRAVVPVRKGFEKAVMFYMETGLIWNGQGYTLDHNDDLYLSVAEELQNSEGDVETTWETKIPTNFRIIHEPDGPFGTDGTIEL